MGAEWVKVGVEVIERASGWGPTFRYAAKKKIAKVYKNGNFTIEGDSQQWAAYGEHARKTGQAGHYRSNCTIVPLTDEVRADIIRTRIYEAAVKVVCEEAERLDRLWRRRDVDETIAEAARINDAAEGTNP